MNQVESLPLWLGHAGEGRDFRQIFDAGIEALVHLAVEDPPPQPPRELICCHFPLVDGTGNRSTLMSLAIHTVATLVKVRMPTLVLCSAGVSRAPAIAAAALALAHRQPVEEWLARVVECHPSDVSPGLWNEVSRLLPILRD
jgi:protein-tyrosine phosphatase